MSNLWDAFTVGSQNSCYGVFSTNIY